MVYFKILLSYALVMVAMIGGYYLKLEEVSDEFICTDTSCEWSRVPGGAIPIPNVYEQKIKEPEDV